MKFVLASDLHLEHRTMTKMFGLSERFIQNQYDADVLLLAGDTMDTSIFDSSQTKKLFAALNNFYPQVFYVMGNHEHYTGDFAKTRNRLNEAFSEFSRIKVLEKEGIDLDCNIRIFGGTMWTDFNRNDPIAMWAAKRSMNDYQWIKNSASPVLYRTTNSSGETEFKTRVGNITPEDVYADHLMFIDVLSKDIEQNLDKKYIVMTHHSPTYAMCHQMFINDPLNSMYHNNLDDFILDRPQIKTWVFGHTHGSKEMQLGECAVILNARGYPGESSSNNFDGKVFEL